MIRGTKFKLILFLILLAVSVAGITRSILIANYSLLIVFVPLLAIALYYIVRVYSQNNRKIKFLFDSIAEGDYSFQFTESQGSLDEKVLHMSLNRIRDIMFEEKRQVLQKERYYEIILNSVNTGILVLNENGSIYQHNEAVLTMLGMPILTHVNQLQRIDEKLPAVFHAIQAGDKKQITFVNERGSVILTLYASAVEVRGKTLRILAVTEIGGELEEMEIESWTKLIRVLTHEIMNSISPITSLSETLLEMTPEGDSDMRSGLEVIRTTGRNLISFVESYRRFTRIPKPEPRLFDLKPFLERMIRLTEQENFDAKITLEMDPEDLILYADEKLTSQVMLNLLKNAVQATDGISDAEILVQVSCPSGEQVRIEVQDNGPGIPAEVLQQIFVPFFTTKEQGSGIGLSLSRQIMRLQDGSLTVSSVPGKTRFMATFK